MAKHRACRVPHPGPFPEEEGAGGISTMPGFSCILHRMVTATQRSGPGPKLPLDASVGYQVRITHRLIQRAL